MRSTLVVTITASGTMLLGYIIWKGLVKPPAIFKSRCPSNLVMAASESGTMDQNLMADYIQRIIKPYMETISKPNCLLLLNEARSHNTPEIKKYIQENGCLPIYVPGDYTDCCQPLDVSVNKPVKCLYREKYEKWQADPATTQYQPISGNRKRPGYDVMADWVSEALLKIDGNSIKTSFTECGMYYTDSHSNGLAFVSALNSRLKTVLFVNKDSTIYEQFISLCYMVTNKFRDRSILLNKIQEYITIYKAHFFTKFSERAEIDDSIEIDFDDLIY